MKKFRTIIIAIAVSLFFSGIQSCYVEKDTGRHRWGFHHHDRDRDRDRDHDHGGVIIVDPDRR